MSETRGQIIERTKNKFLIRIYTGRGEDGKRTYYNKTIAGKKAAQQHLTEKLREIDTGSYIEPSKMKVKTFLEMWLNDVAAQRVIKKTLQSYRYLINAHMIPAIGNYSLLKLSPEHIQKLYNDMAARGLSTRTIRYTHSVLKSALKQAQLWNRIYRNPAELVKPPRLIKTEMQTLTPDEAKKFAEAAIYSPYGAYLTLLLTTGMRPSEALGLQWPDVDLDNNRITVKRTLSRIKGSGYKLEEPKTKKSRRTIPIPAEVSKDLKELRKQQLEDIIKSPDYNNKKFVFANSQTGEPLHERFLVTQFKRVLKNADLPDIRLYDLRHTCATLLLIAGLNPKVVAERLGHASIIITLDTYSHVLPGMQKDATNQISNMVFGS